MENQKSGKGLSTAAFVLGIVSAVLAWFYLVNIAALLCGIIGIVLAVKGKKQALASGEATGMATAGLVLSIIGTCLAGIGFVSCTLCVAAAGSATKAVASAATAAAADSVEEAANATGAAMVEAANSLVDSITKSLG